LVHPLGRILVIGAQGFIGSHLYRYFSSFDPETLGTHHRPHPHYALLDLKAPSFDFSLKGYAYALITAGMGNPRLCEERAQESYLCNVESPLLLGRELIRQGVTPIFFSTDYVFGGSESSYTESSPTSPLNVYGRGKAELEKRAREEFADQCLIIRLSKVYGIEKGDGTLYDEMVTTLIKQRVLYAAKDQIFAPIFIQDLILAIVALLSSGKRGLFQCAGNLSASRYEMAVEVAKKLGCEIRSVRPISLDELEDGVLRPKKLILQSFWGRLPWKEAIQKIVDQYALSSR